MKTIKQLDIIPHSQRGHFFILEHARIEKNDDIIVYKQIKNGINLVYNIPYINTNMLLLGKGCSITTEALLFMSAQGILIGITGGKGLPLYNEIYNISFINPANEYRPVKYNQIFANIFFNENKRLKVAKKFFMKRIDNALLYYHKLIDEKIINFTHNDYLIVKQLFEEYKNKLDNVKNNNEILLVEANYTKEIYKTFATLYNVKFSRDHHSNDDINQNLTHLNYICYGIGNIVLYTLGISHSFSVFHGKTRRGALTFDIADIIKDAFSIPFAFYGYSENLNDTEIKYKLIEYLYRYNIIKDTIQFIKNITEEFK